MVAPLRRSLVPLPSGRSKVPSGRSKVIQDKVDLLYLLKEPYIFNRIVLRLLDLFVLFVFTIRPRAPRGSRRSLPDDTIPPGLVSPSPHIKKDVLIVRLELRVCACVWCHCTFLRCPVNTLHFYLSKTCFVSTHKFSMVHRLLSLDTNGHRSFFGTSACGLTADPTDPSSATPPSSIPAVCEKIETRTQQPCKCLTSIYKN